MYNKPSGKLFFHRYPAKYLTSLGKPSHVVNDSVAKEGDFLSSVAHRASYFKFPSLVNVPTYRILEFIGKYIFVRIRIKLRHILRLR